MAEGTLQPGDDYRWSDVRALAVERFGIRRFRPGQRELIEAALAGQDVLGVLPTGAGKSLCFQLPSLLLEGVVVVVSPLLALMRDQSERLDASAIEGARLDSTVRPAARREIEDELRAGGHDVVFVTPERLTAPDTLDLLRRRRVSLLVVDEAHCVSQWGRDFRPAYLELKAAIRALGRPPVMALTATAPPELARDVLAQLGIPEARVVQGGIERPNLRFGVRRTVSRDEKERTLLELLDGLDGPAIVYAATTRRVTEVHDWLRARGVDAVRYHGQLPTRERTAAQDRFMHGDARVVVATNAFGLGIDKADVRLVAHWNLPESVEAYYQEAGRAGRDGAPAYAVLLFRLEDRGLRRAFIGGRHPRRHEAAAVLDALRRVDREGRRATLAELARESGLGERRTAVIVGALEALEAVSRRRGRLVAHGGLHGEALERFYASFEERHAADRERLETMMAYGRTTGCRVQFLREYFGEAEGARCGACDNCALPAASGAREADEAAARPPQPHELRVADDQPPPLDAGLRVHHAAFGAGEVVATEGLDVTVRFGADERVVRREYLAGPDGPLSGSAPPP